METVTRRWRLGLLLACLWLATSGAACGLFRPAKPEPPSGSALVPDYSTVEATLLTMKRGIEDKARSNGLSAYIGALADTNTDHRAFHAFFDPLTVSRFTGTGRSVPDDWDRSLEAQKFYPSFVRKYSGSYDLEFTHDDSQGNDDIGDDTALLHLRYVAYTTLSNDSTLIIANGFANLYLVRSSANRWAVVRWDDREQSPPPNPEALSFGQQRLESQ